MGLLLMNVVAIAIIICYRGAEGETINLDFFERQVAFRVETLDGSNSCAPICDDTLPPKTTKKETKPVKYNEMGSYMDSDTNSYCNGYVSQCRYLSGSKDDTLEYCHKDDAVVWYKSSLMSDGIGEQTIGCVKSQLAYSLKGGDECHVCKCHCINERKHPIKDDVWSFSLAEELSDSADNKVVVGVRFTNHGQVIRLEIKENDIDSEEPGVWKNVTDDPALIGGGAITDERVRILTHDFRTIMLDTIVLPENTVITGLRFEELTSPNGTNALRLRVRGTKLNVDKTALSDEADWYGGGVDQVGTKWWSTVTQFQATDTEVFFEGKDVDHDMGKATVPTLDSSNIETGTQRDFPLSGMKLSLVRLGGKNTIIVPAIHPLFLNLHDDPDGDKGKPKKNGADTANLQFLLMAMLPWVIISNLSN